MLIEQLGDQVSNGAKVVDVLEAIGKGRGATADRAAKSACSLPFLQNMVASHTFINGGNTVLVRTRHTTSGQRHVVPCGLGGGGELEHLAAAERFL